MYVLSFFIHSWEHFQTRHHLDWNKFAKKKETFEPGRHLNSRLNRKKNSLHFSASTFYTLNDFLCNWIDAEDCNKNNLRDQRGSKFLYNDLICCISTKRMKHFHFVCGFSYVKIKYLFWWIMKLKCVFHYM